MPMVYELLTILALVAFLLGTVQLQTQPLPRVNWVAVGLAFITLIFLLKG
jgi:hypothetical protein